MGEKAPVHDPELRWFGRFGLRLGEGLRLDVVHVNAALAAGRTRAGPGTLLEIRSCEIWPDVVSLNSVMNVGAQNGQWQDALDLLSAPKQLHLQPDLITYGSTFCAFDRGGQWHRALQMLRSMPSRVVEPNLISYNSVLAAVGTWPRAMELLVKAQVSLLLPDVISFGASQTDAWQHAAGILGRMLQISVKPNAVVFNRALSASCRSGRPWRQAIRLLEQAEERRLADLITYSSAIAACATGRSWQYALALLNAIRLAKLKPNEIAFNSVLSAISEWTRALAILSSMDRKTVASFGAAIGTCEKAGQWQMALQLLVMMGEAEIEANVITFNSAISACTQGSEWPMALALLSTMASEHLWPDTVSMNSAISACAESGRLWVAVSLIESMSEFTTSPNTITLNSAMNVCEKGGFWAVALKLLGDFGRRRLDSTTISLHTAGSSCVKALHWQHAQHIFDTEDDVTITTLAATAWELSEKAQPLCSVLSELQWQMAGDLRGFSALEKK